MADTAPPSIILPSVHPTPSYWQDPLSPFANHRSTSTLPPTADVVIIGSGITGASIAHKILTQRPSTKVIMLEARELCCGATGRNGGHLARGQYLEFAQYCTAYGVPEAIKILRFEDDTVRSVGEFIREQGIQCDLHSVEGVTVFLDEGEFAKAVKTVDLMNHTMAPRKDQTHYSNGIPVPQIHQTPSARDEFHIPAAKGFITMPAATLSPYKLVCALISNSLYRGLNLQTNTPALSLISPSPSLSPIPITIPEHTWTIRTPRGSIHAQMVVLATNAFTPQLYPPLALHLTPCRGQMLAAAPNPTLIAAGGLTRSYSFLYRGGYDDYLIVRPPGSTGEGDFLLGGGRSFAPGGEEGVLENKRLSEEVREYLRGAVRGYFGGEKGGGDEEGKGVKSEWTGIMGFTEDRFPVVGEAETGLWVCAGFNGHGMAFSFRCAEAVVAMLLGGTEEEEQVRRWLPACFRIDRLRLIGIGDRERKGMGKL